MRKHAIGLIALLAAVAGCTDPPALRSTEASNVQLLDTTELPSPVGRSADGSISPFLIGAFDKLKIDVFGMPDISAEEIQADASGRISVPLAGEIEAAGRSPGEVAALIESRLRRYVRDPQVAVNLVDTVSHVVTVDGEVQKPGMYPVLADMTLMKAVARAEGLTELAKPTEVVIFRTVEGQKYAALYDLRSIRQGAYDDPRVYPDDIVVVGQSARRQLFRDALAVVPALITPLIYLVR